MLDFEVIKQLGSGSFGRVLKVKKVGNSEVYAMKMVKMAKLSHKEKQLTLNQIRLLASIDSPYVIQYKGAFFQEQGSTLSILMQYADGGDLEGIIKKKRMIRQRLDQNYILKVSYEILKGLKFLHQNHIMHRDIKTANIFFAKGMAKLGDLNLSKVIKQQFAMTNAGTPYYTSPQIWYGQKYTSNCDIWSLGCVIYEMCTFKAPFEANNMHQLMRKVTSGFYDPIPSIYSKKLSSLIRKCLLVDNKRRPSAQEILKSIDFGDVNDLFQGQAHLIQTIKCPYILKNINNRLPVSCSVQKNRQKIKSHYYHNPKSQYSSERYRARSIKSVHQNNQNKFIKIKQIIKTPESNQTRKMPISPIHQYSPSFKAMRY